MASNELDKAVQNLITMMNKKIEITKVWENASPTANFPNQTINVDLSEYDFALVLFCYDKNSRMVPPSIVPVPHAALNESNTQMRHFIVHDNNIVFDATVSPATMIPKYVFGMKGVD